MTTLSGMDQPELLGRPLQVLLQDRLVITDLSPTSFVFKTLSSVTRLLLVVRSTCCPITDPGHNHGAHMLSCNSFKYLLFYIV